MAEIDLTEIEKGILRDGAVSRQAMRQAAQQAASDAERAEMHLVSAINVILRMRGLDPKLYRLNFDLNKDIWELSPLDVPAAAQPLALAAEPAESPEDETE